MDWSSAQWEAFAKKHSYAERKRSAHPRGSSLLPAPRTSPRAGTSSEGRDKRGGVSGCTLCCFPWGFLPSRLTCDEREGWKCLWTLVRCARARLLLSPLLLCGLRIRKQLARSKHLLLAPPLPRLPLPSHHCMLCEVMSRESLRRPAPVRDPPDLWIEKHGRIVEPALGRLALVTGLVALALAPLPARSQAVESVVGVTRLDRCLPVSGRGGIDCGLRTAIDPVEFAHARFLGVIGLGLWTATDPIGIALGVAGRGLWTATGHGGSVRDPMFAREVAVTGCGQAIPLATLVTVRGHGCGRLLSCGRVWRLLLSPRLPLSQKRRLQWLLLLWRVLWRRFRLLCRISPGFS